jgi:hypothetical protein
MRLEGTKFLLTLPEWLSANLNAGTLRQISTRGQVEKTRSMLR